MSNGSALFVPQEKLHVINQYTNSIEKSVADNQDVRRLICTLKLLFFTTYLPRTVATIVFWGLGAHASQTIIEILCFQLNIPLLIVKAEHFYK